MKPPAHPFDGEVSALTLDGATLRLYCNGRESRRLLGAAQFLALNDAGR